LPAAAKAGIDQPSRAQGLERARVILGVLALATRRTGEGEPEPGEILFDRRLVFALAAGLIQVFNA
jgi:hypothetical protein